MTGPQRLRWATAGSGLTVGRAEAVRPLAQVAEGQALAIPWWEDLALFLPVAVLGSVIGIYAIAELHLYHIDNVARTFSAAMVLYGIEPKLANIGFIWAPIPALLRLPIVAAFPQLAYNGGAGAIVSSIAAGICLILLNHIVSLYVPAGRVRLMMLALYQLNPLVVYLTISGLSELVFIAFVLSAWLAFQRLAVEEPLPFVQVAVMGGACAGAVLSRYESLSFVLVLGAFFTLFLYLVKRPGQLAVTEGLTIAFLTPWAYAFGLWLFFNAMIMGSPLYFLSGKASLAEFQESFLLEHVVLQGLEGNPIAATLFAIRAAWDAFPPYVVLAPVLTLYTLVRRDLLLLALLATGATFPAFQWLISLEGQSSGFIRYHVYEILYGVLLLAYALHPRVLPFLRRVSPTWLALTVGLILAAGNYGTWVGLEDPGIVVVGEAEFLRAVAARQWDKPGLWGQGERDPTAIARYLRDELWVREPDALVMVDEQRASDIVLFAGHLDRWITTHYSGFLDAVRNPVGRVNFILVPERVTTGRDIILDHYPLLFSEGAPFVTLEREFGTAPGTRWRLYRVRPPDEPTNTGGPGAGR